MRDLRYIFKRILIGVGIFIGISFFNKCSVEAYTEKFPFNNTNYIQNDITLNSVINNSDNVFLVDYAYLSFYKNINNNIYVCNKVNSKCIYYKIDNMNFSYSKLGIGLSIAKRWNGTSFNSGSQSQALNSVFVISNGVLPKLNNDNNFEFYDNAILCSFQTGVSYRGETLFSSGNCYKNNNSVEVGTYLNVQSLSDTASSGDKLMNFFATYNWNYKGSYVVDNNNIISISSIPEFVSFNMTKRTNNNVILGYIFRPEFTDFNTTDYDYQYSFNGNGWLSLTENEQIVNINGNGIFSVRIKEKSTNDIIDSATFTITNIGTFNDNVDYNIKYSGEYRTDNFQNNQVSSHSSSIIESYQIYVDYFPKSSLLKYQYQYVVDGDSLSTWTDLASSNNGSFTYTATDNGVLYARILDSSDNVLYSSTFTVSTIGDLAFDNNLGVYSGLLDKLSNKINFTGPISSIIDIPIQLVLTISSGLSGGLTCSDYSLGNLMGTNLVIPCVNIKQHLGNDLYATIDLIIACCMIYHIIKMFGDIYTNLLFIEKNPIQYLGKRGD